MDKRVLAAYASKHGATAEIAERIGQTLRQAGLSADVLPAERAGEPASYGAVILGSAAWRLPRLGCHRFLGAAIAGALKGEPKHIREGAEELLPGV